MRANEISVPRPFYAVGPVGAALVIGTTAIALAIGSGVVDWSYWWLLVPGVPATLATLFWLGAVLWPDP